PEKPMHNKFCIIDERILINGSYNWTYYAENKNEENILITDNTEVIHKYLNEFKRIKNSLSIVIKSVKIDLSKISSTDIFSVKEYVSNDYYLRGKERDEPKLITKAFTISPNNKKIGKNKFLIDSGISKHNKKLKQSVGVHVHRGNKGNNYSKMINAHSKIPIEYSSKFGINKDNYSTPQKLDS
ncbi:MAG: phospholipase D-like domain-containing protein, partial [Saprospiraceae bacterium]